MQVLERETLGRNESELGGSGDLGRCAPSAGPSAGRIEQASSKAKYEWETDSKQVL